MYYSLESWKVGKLVVLDNGQIHKKESGNYLVYTCYHPRLNRPKFMLLEMLLFYSNAVIGKQSVNKNASPSLVHFTTIVMISTPDSNASFTAVLYSGSMIDG